MRILNLGAGVQSTTVALMGVQNWENWHCSEPLAYEPVGLIDYAIFADTQEEPKAVYAHLEWLKAKCAQFFPILVRTAGKLGDDLIKGIPAPGDKNVYKTRFVSIPSYTLDEGGNLGIIPRQCTTDYKVNVIERTIRRDILGLAKGQRVPSDADVTQIMGLSYDEAGRIMRVKARPNPFTIVFPLFDLEMTRGSCKAWLKKWYPLRQVPRSACVFCPYHSQEEWRAIKAVPEDWARAVEVDNALRSPVSRYQVERRATAYVHVDRVPLEQADLDDPETREKKRGQEMFGFLQECEGMCGV